MDSNHELAASLIWRAIADGTTIDALPAPYRPSSRQQGYAIQACLPAIASQAVAGWKIAATSLAGQQHIGVSGPLAGRILASFAHPDAATVTARGNRMRVAETEFGFVLARELPPRGKPYTVDEVLDAVARVVPVIEIPNSRLHDFVRAGEAQLLADDACAGHFVVGDATGADWRAIDYPSHAVRGTVVRDGTTVVERGGTGAAVLGDPRVALAWLVNEVNALGVAIEAGQFVSTGTCMAPLPMQPGDAIRADFGVLGSVSAHLADDAD